MAQKKNIAVETDNATIDLAIDTLKISKQAIVFVNTKRSAEKVAEDISKKIKNEDKTLIKISESVLKALSKPTKQCKRLSKCIRKGIAFHHAGLTQKQRETIEDNFRSGNIKIICATPTLAMGVDLPAYRAIIRDLKRFSNRGMTNIPVLEYLQIAGRAGRPKFDDHGEAICIAASEAEKRDIFERYIMSEPEDIYSKLAVEPALRTYLLSLIATNFVRTKEQIIDFFKETFWAYQFSDMNELKIKIMAMLELLDKWEFIVKDDDDFRSANSIDNFNVKATLIGKRVAELYIDPLTAHFIIGCLKIAASKELNEISFLQMISHTLEIRPLLNVRIKEYEKIYEKLSEYSSYLLEKEPSMYDPEYEEFLSSIKTSMMFFDWVNEKDEESLMEEYNVRPGELRAKLDIADWLIFSSNEIVKLLNFKNLSKELIKTRLRMKYGVKEELLGLLRLKQIGRVRARKLFRNKIKTIEDVKKAPVDVLVQILGKNTTINIKRQVGEEVKAVPERKRKGQISLKDYNK